MTRVYVAPVKERFGELRGITGATMEDGTVYRARRGGVMTVDRADHLAAMKRDPRNADLLAVESFVVRGDHPGRTCPVCAFNGWRWQTHCPRDGAEMREESNG